VCLSVCLSAPVRPHYCTGPDVTRGRGRGCPLVVHYWADLQSGHRLRCYGNITRTLVTSLRPSRNMTTYCKRPAGRGLRALLAADWRMTGSFSTLLRQSGLWASTGAVLATKSERKMLASTCLYSLYAWLDSVKATRHTSQTQVAFLQTAKARGRASGLRKAGSAKVLVCATRHSPQ